MVVAEVFAVLGLKVDKGSFGEAGAKIAGLAKAFSAVSLAMRGVETMKDWVTDATHAATETLALSNAVGLSAQQMREWGYVTEQGGGTAQSFARGIGMFESQLKAFAMGTHSKLIIDRMKELHISVSDAKTALSSQGGMDKMLGNVADKMKAMGDTPERGVLGRGIFGAKASREVVADMARGSDGIEEMRKRFRALAGTVTDTQMMDLRNVGNRMKDIGIAWDNIKLRAVAAFGPTLLKAFEAVTNFMMEHGEQIKDVLVGVFEAIGIAVKELISIGEDFFSAIEPLVDIFKLVFAAVGSIGKALGGASGAAGGLHAAIWIVLLPLKAFVFSLNLIIKATTFIVGLFVKLFTYIGSKIGSVTDAVGSFGDAFVSLWNDVKSAAEAAFTYIRNLPVLKQIIDAIGSVTKFLDGDPDKVKDDAFYKMFNGSPKAPSSAAAANSSTRASGSLMKGVDFGLTSVLKPMSSSGFYAHTAGAHAATAKGATTNNAPVTNHITNNFHGVKDASDASERFSSSLDKVLRHAAAGAR